MSNNFFSTIDSVRNWYASNPYLRTAINTLFVVVAGAIVLVFFHVIVWWSSPSPSQYSMSILQHEVDSIKQYKYTLQKEYDSLLREEQKYIDATVQRAVKK